MIYSLLRSGKCQYYSYQWRCFLPSTHGEQRVTSKNKSVQNYRWIHAVHGWIQNKLFTFAPRLEYVCVVRSCVSTAYTLLFKIRSSQRNATNVSGHVIKKLKNAFGPSKGKITCARRRRYDRRKDLQRRNVFGSGNHRGLDGRMANVTWSVKRRNWLPCGGCSVVHLLRSRPDNGRTPTATAGEPPKDSVQEIVSRPAD